MMNNINWKARFKNPQFVIGFVSAMILLAEQIARLFGYELDKVMTEQLLEAVRSLLVVLGLLGIVTDPTTQGLSDSKQALNYTEPRKDGK